jgi:hypothetical protein
MSPDCFVHGKKGTRSYICRNIRLTVFVITSNATIQDFTSPVAGMFLPMKTVSRRGANDGRIPEIFFYAVQSPIIFHISDTCDSQAKPRKKCRSRISIDNREKLIECTYIIIIDDEQNSVHYEKYYPCLQ